MTTTTPRQFRSVLKKPMPDFAAMASAVDQVADANNIGDIVRPSDKPEAAAEAPATATGTVTPIRKEKAPRKQTRAPERKLTFMVPVYLLEAIEKKKTIDQTKRFVILSAFKEAGFEVREVDLMEDGRRGRE